MPKHVFHVLESARRHELSLVALLTLASGALHFLGIGNKDLWLDEASSLYFAGLPMREMLELVMRADQHPPLYYALLGLVLHCGNSETLLRLPSLLFSTATVPVLYAAAKSAGGRRAGLFAALMFIVSPAHLRYAQEARMYALMAFGAALALAGLFRLAAQYREDAGGRRYALVPWVLYTAGTAIALHAQHTGALLVLLSQPAFYMIRHATSPDTRWKFFSRWLAAHAVVLILWLPLLPVFLAQSRQVAAGFWIPAPDTAGVTRALSYLYAAHVHVPSWLGALAAVFTGAVIILSWRALRRHSIPMFAAVISWQLLGPLTLLAISLVTPLFVARALLWTTLPFFISAGTFTATGNPRMLRRISLLGMVILSLAGVYGYHAHYEKEPWRRSTKAVTTAAQAGDLVLFHSPTGQIAFEYYAASTTVPLRLAGVPATRFEGGWEPRMRAEDTARIRTVRDRERRIWLVYTHFEFSDPDSLVLSAIRDAHWQESEHRFGGIRIFRFTPTQNSPAGSGLNLPTKRLYSKTHNQ